LRDRPPKNKQGGVVSGAGTESRARELTLRGLILGILLTFIFTAANAYLGLKVGLTFATSIPAAVISMAVLSFFRGSSILENNIVQTVASAAGALAAIIFVLPGLVIVGWWAGFDFWTTFLVCASGGVIGVVFTIPLRRAMVTTSDLPYPEGVAAAEVLKVGSSVRGEAGMADADEAREGLLAVIYGATASAGLAALTATRVAAGEVQSFFRIASGVTGYDFGLSLALFGAGHLVGLSVGLALLLGLAIAWLGAVPVLSALAPAAGGNIADLAMHVWSTQVRFIGAGAIAVSALWTLARLARPVAMGLVSTLATVRNRKDAHPTDVDLSPFTIAGLTFACLVIVAGLVLVFVHGTPLQHQAPLLIILTIVFVVLGGFLVSAICGYLAGLVGSTNSPVSGVGILAILLYAGLLAALVPTVGDGGTRALVAFALFTLSIVFAASVTSNDNLQDLKTGQLVDAAPWAQQIALIVGILAGAVIIPPVLDLLAHAYGFAGQEGGTAVTGHAPLPAPQAVLISALARGVFGDTLNWSMLITGGVIGAAVVALDEFLGAMKKIRLPPLGVCIGIYLPMSASLPVVLGAIVSEWFKRRARRSAAPERRLQLGVLAASGLIVGESLFGVALAALIVESGQAAPLALVGAGFRWATAIGIIVFAGAVFTLYRWILRSAS
jgi:putative OPT family oligopeptide transporter